MKKNRHRLKISFGFYSAPFIILFTILTFSIANEALAQQTRRALIIGVGSYPASSGWNNLGSAKDFEILKSALTGHGFKEENIIGVLDEDATKAGIILAIDELSAKIEKGDIVLIHFSGHGQQMPDDNGDEIYDNLDEALIPFDAALKYDPSEYVGENHLRDDEFGQFIEKIRRKAGPTGDVIVTIDACHSGTATRSQGNFRGTDVIFAQPGYSLSDPTGEDSGQGMVDVVNEIGMAPLVVISASGASEKNKEYNGNGSLSYVFCKVLESVNEETTYREIFTDIEKNMGLIVSRQNPQIEGDLDRFIFGGAKVEQHNYITVKQWINDTTLLINAGQLNTLTNKSVVSLYPIGTTIPNTANTITKGVVINSRYLTALVSLASPITQQHATNSWIFVEELHLFDHTISIKLDPGLPSNLLSEFKKQFAVFGITKFVDENPEVEIILSKPGEKRIQIIAKDGQVFFDEKWLDGENIFFVNAAIESIEQYLKAELLRGLESENPTIKLSLSFIPASCHRDYIDTSNVQSCKNGKAVFKVNDCFRYQITNEGTRDAYFALLLISADNSIEVLIPEEFQNYKRQPGECFIQKGETIILPYTMRFMPPNGEEVFKLVSDIKAVSLKPAAQVRGSSNHSILPPENINIFTCIVEIVPEK